jgi:hypothetical protein
MTLGQTRREWKPSTGPDRYRRGMYTFFWRATPHPSLTVFDAPDAFSACTRRIRSNTPLQALTLLNDRAFVEFAQGLAVRLLRETAAESSDRIKAAFRLCLSREPSPAERERLLELLRMELDHFAAAPEEAKQFTAGAGGSPGEQIELAAWTSVARVLLNLDETITRE